MSIGQTICLFLKESKSVNKEITHHVHNVGGPIDANQKKETKVFTEEEARKYLNLLALII